MPDETDLVKAGAEGIAKGTTDSILEPFKALVGEFCSEFGKGLGDYGRLFRVKMRLRVMQRAKKLLNDANVESCGIPPKLFFPIIEYASLEDDEMLQEKWAALLANAATRKSKIHIRFPEMLRQLSSDEARLLDGIFDYVCSQISGDPAPARALVAPKIELWEPLNELGTIHFFDASDLRPMLDNLESLGVLNLGGLTEGLPDGTESPRVLDAEIHMTSLGFQFVSACRPPGS